VGVIDHHPIIGKPKIIINPTNTIPSKDVPSASALVYALYRHMFDDNETIRKIAFLGALGDLMLIKSLPYLGIDIDNSEYFLNQIPQTIFNHMFNIFNLTNIDPRNSKIIYEYMINNVNDSILPMILYPEEFEIQIQKLYKNQRKTLKSIINTAEHVEDKEIIFVQFKRKQNIYFDMLRVTLNAIYPTHTLFISGLR
jgi:single-stranded DNA-specific DHH superfamily exonuclease